jgi:hypothetical protein
MSAQRKATPYELATHKGRQISESSSADYCGSCSLDLHCAQLADPSSWVHSSVKQWEVLGGWPTPALHVAEPTKPTPNEAIAKALALCVASLDQLLPYLGHVPADVGLLNDALVAARPVLKDLRDKGVIL